MWLEFQNESDTWICRLYKSSYKKSDYKLQLYVLDSDYHYNRAKIRKAEIKLFLMIYKKELVWKLEIISKNWKIKFWF